jgi:hypothetical protein
MDDSGGFGAPPPPPPPSAGGGGQLPQRDFGDVFSTAFNVYKAHFAQLLKIVALIVVPLTLLNALIANVVFAPKKETVLILGQEVTGAAVRSTGASYFVLVFGLLIGAVIGYFLQAVVLRAGALAAIGDNPDIDESMRYGLRRFGSVWWIAILVALVVVSVILLGALLAFGVVGLGVFVILVGAVWAFYSSTMLSMSVPSLIVEGQRGTEALSRSWNLVKGHFWHALGIILVAGIIAGIIGGIIGAIGGSNWFLSWVFGAIGQIIVAPFVALVTIVLYLDLRARTESLTAETLRQELSRTA